jgi:SAM-dependent methyltransferase
MKLNEDFTEHSRLADVGRWYITRFVRSVADRLPPGTLLLDAGAGECAYKRFFAHCRYLAMDLGVGETAWNYANLDSFARLDRLPLADDCLDAVLCTQVLEHLEWPRESVAEFRRVLKPGGTLYLTAPMAQAEHQAPHDFFRYTSFGLRAICADAGFRITQLAPFGGLPTRMAYELPRIMDLFPGSGVLTGRVRIGGLLLLPVRAATFLAMRLLQGILLWADRFDRTRNDPFGWSLIAQK